MYKFKKKHPCDYFYAEPTGSYEIINISTGDEAYILIDKNAPSTKLMPGRPMCIVGRCATFELAVAIANKRRPWKNNNASLWFLGSMAFSIEKGRDRFKVRLSDDGRLIKNFDDLLLAESFAESLNK